MIMIQELTGFIICASVIFFAGKKLSFYGDLISEYSGLGKAWIGLIFMSFVTSLPELMVGISSSAIVESADLAVGDILGSCAFNLGILSIMDIFTPKHTPLFSHVSKAQILAGSFSIILAVLAGLGLFLDYDILLIPFVGASSIAFALVYFISLKVIYNYQKKLSISEILTNKVNQLSFKQVIFRYVLFAFIIIVAATALPHFADKIADHTGLGKSFVATLFLATSTSLPEIAVSYSAIRRGSVDMAVGNLMGSNIFNFFILFIDDIFYTNGYLLNDASEINLISVFFVVIMTATAIIGFIFPSREKTIFMSWDTLTIFLLYLINITLLFLYS